MIAFPNFRFKECSNIEDHCIELIGIATKVRTGELAARNKVRTYWTILRKASTDLAVAAMIADGTSPWAFVLGTVRETDSSDAAALEALARQYIVEAGVIREAIADENSPLTEEDYRCKLQQVASILASAGVAIIRISH